MAERKNTSLDISKLTADGFSNSSDDRVSAMMMLQSQTGCSREMINRLSFLISNLLTRIGIK